MINTHEYSFFLVPYLETRGLTAAYAQVVQSPRISNPMDNNFLVPCMERSWEATCNNFFGPICKNSWDPTFIFCLINVQKHVVQHVQDMSLLNYFSVPLF